MMGASGMMESLESVHLSRGTKIIAHGYAMCVQYFVIYDDKMNAVEIFNGDDVHDDLDEHELDKYFSEFHHIEDTVRPISKKFGIGFYYDESGVLIDDAIIEKSLERAKVMAQFRKDVAERKERESKEKTERLKKEYSYLQRVDSKRDHKVCGANIRTELKRNFPTTKFSVRYKSFSGGDEYYITWDDGPTTKQVDAVVDKYGDMKPDAYSMGDYWDCVPSEFNHLYGSVGYVMTSRTITSETIAKTRARFADLTEENMKHYNYGIDGANNYAYTHGRSVDDMIHWLARSIDWQDVAPKQEEKQSAVCGDFEIVDYSDKAFAVVGDTKSIKDDLKRLGGRFNFRLSCGAGWIFPKTKMDDVKALLNIINL
jgi:hypothetical protein